VRRAVALLEEGDVDGAREILEILGAKKVDGL
jgi:hypothetical protein